MKSTQIYQGTGRQQSAAITHKARFEVLAAVTMKHAAFWGKKTQFIPYRRHINSSLQSPAS
jgi:hypothetical protein